jgi:hypothetical protein
MSQLGGYGLHRLRKKSLRGDKWQGTTNFGRVSMALRRTQMLENDGRPRFRGPQRQVFVAGVEFRVFGPGRRSRAPSFRPVLANGRDQRRARFRPCRKRRIKPGASAPEENPLPGRSQTFHSPSFAHIVSTFAFVARSISIIAGHSRSKPSAFHLRVASMPIFEP